MEGEYLRVHVNRGSVAKGYCSIGTKHSKRGSWVPLKMILDQLKIFVLKHVRVKKLIQAHVQRSTCRASLRTKVGSANRVQRRCCNSRVRRGGSSSGGGSTIPILRLAGAVAEEIQLRCIGIRGTRVRRGGSSSL